MGPNARTHLIRDPNCDLRWHLNCVPPETPIQNIVDRVVKPMPEKAWPVYAVSEPTLLPMEQVIAAVTGPSVGLADLEAMLKRLLPAVPAQAPPT